MDGHAQATGKARPTWMAFLRACGLLGVTGFGGGLAILAQAGDLFERKRWLTEREWVHTATVAQLVPGGAATNALAYAGLRFFGPLGALAGVLVYVTPAAAMMIAFGLGYSRVHEVPHLDALLAGFNAAVVGLVVAVTWRLGQAGLRRGWQAVLAGLALALERLGHATVLEVIVFGILAGLAADSVQKGFRLRARRRHRSRANGAPRDAEVAAPGAGPTSAPGAALLEQIDPVVPASGGAARSEPPAGNADDDGDGPGGAGLGALWLMLIPRTPGAFQRRLDALKSWLGLSGLAVPVGLALVLTFARVGAVAYGGGFTIVPLLEREAVEQHAWISHQEFADAIALGQVTPGPVIIAATFIGTRAGGVLGGILATLGVFGVPALMVIGGGAWIDRWRRARAVKAALRGLVPAVVGMMAAAAFGLAGAGIHDETGVLLAAVAFVGVAQFRLNPAVVVFLSGAVRVGLTVFANV
jgi:chromate transporter